MFARLFKDDERREYKMINSVQEAIMRLEDTFAERIANGLKILFQTKHLYQSVIIDYTDFVKTVLSGTGVSPVISRSAENNFSPKVGKPWLPIEGGRRDSQFVYFVTPDVKLFCKNCARIEAFNPISTEDFLLREISFRSSQTKRGLIQVFVFSFLCQACKIVPEVFIVRREDFKLTLCGRAPIEHIDVPSVIPKQVKKFYSGALLAYQSGQTLAGNFLLRTLIEQWAQFLVDEKGLQADEAIDRYMEKLPSDFKARFPSLRVLYSDLSSDIHMATGSNELFEKAKAQIDEHYNARRLYKLS